MGRSGAGKSTCIHLLMRFWDVTDGTITIGGHDVRAFPQRALRELIAWVPQDVYLFNMTIPRILRIPKVLPIDVQLSNRSANRSHLQISAAPIRKHRGSFGIGVTPLAMRPTSPALTFLTSEQRQLSRNLSILHAVEITVSNHTGPPLVGICVLCGSARPSSS